MPCARCGVIGSERKRAMGGEDRYVVFVSGQAELNLEEGCSIISEGLMKMFHLLETVDFRCFGEIIYGIVGVKYIHHIS